MIRRLITSLLVVMLTLSGAARALASTRDDEDTKITAEEGREARELVEGFNKKFVETQDIGPLVKDYFVPDFASRLNRHAETFPFQLIQWKDGTAPPDSDDLLRFYVASTNCLQMIIRLYAAAYNHAERGEDGDRKEPKLGEVLPPAAIELAKSHPLLRKALEWGDKDEEKAGDGSPASTGGGTSAEVAERPSQETLEKESEEWRIDDVEKLRSFTSVLEGVAKVLRERLMSHPVRFERAEKDKAEEHDEENEEYFDPDEVKVFKNARIVREEFYGYPEGTRLVCTNAGALHVEMVRVDGRLRILTVYLLMDD